MTLLLTVFAAIITTVKWYNRENDNMKLHVLMYMFWGASLMWLVDAVAEYLEVRAEYFTPKPSDMLGDAYLGLSVVALGLVIWLVNVLVKDPSGVIKNALERKN